MVDDLIGKQEVVIKNLGETLKTIKGVAGASIMGMAASVSSWTSMASSKLTNWLTLGFFLEVYWPPPVRKFAVP
jgi:hypothetical protein